MPRQTLSKKTRFEVFKRDKFTCQYCGRKAPDIVLHVDHINPVANGGLNDIVNLITSCYDCNSGKSDRTLDDNSVVEKQRKQMGLLQERREQIELMFEWKKSLSNLDKETIEMIKEYAHARIEPYIINDTGEGTIKNLLKKYSIPDLLDAIDTSADTYLKYDTAGKLTHESVNNFLNKLGGILFNRNLKPIDQKLSQIKNKAKQSFGYFDARTASIILSQYVKALKDLWKYTEEDIISDLENELAHALDGCKNWTAWRNQIEDWTNSIKEKASSKKEELPDDLSDETINSYVQGRMNTLKQKLLLLNFLLSQFKNFDQDHFRSILCQTIKDFLEEQCDLSDESFEQFEKDENAKNNFIWGFSANESMSSLTEYESELFDKAYNGDKEAETRLDLLHGLAMVSSDILDKLFLEEFYLQSSVYTQKSRVAMKNSLFASLTELENENPS